GYDPLAFRLLALGTGYRKSLDFTRAAMDQAQRRLERWRRVVAEAYAATGGRVTEPEPDYGVRKGFNDALADDFNTPKALAAAEMALNLAGSEDAAIRERARPPRSPGARPRSRGRRSGPRVATPASAAGGAGGAVAAAGAVATPARARRTRDRGARRSPVRAVPRIRAASSSAAPPPRAK